MIQVLCSFLHGTCGLIALSTTGLFRRIEGAYNEDGGSKFSETSEQTRYISQPKHSEVAPRNSQQLPASRCIMPALAYSRRGQTNLRARVPGETGTGRNLMRQKSVPDQVGHQRGYSPTGN